MVFTLSGEYYADCHETFRRSSNQTSLMLKEVQSIFGNGERVSILSVGSGTGLFEIPMLSMLMEEGIDIPKFVGVDVNESACNILKQKLGAEFESRVKYEVTNQSFQEFFTESHYDMILFNHTIEYFRDHHLKWIHKSINLLSDDGCLLIFSPNEGGINQIYGELMKDTSGYTPIFSDGLEGLLTSNSIDFYSKIVAAECDISLLRESNNNPEKIKLLSFLSQIDCRSISEAKRDTFLNYFMNLRINNSNAIPHPTTLFVLKKLNTNDG
jgi:SAM-dependent methyltransferase